MNTTSSLLNNADLALVTSAEETERLILNVPTVAINADKDNQIKGKKLWYVYFVFLLQYI